MVLVREKGKMNASSPLHRIVLPLFQTIKKLFLFKVIFERLVYPLTDFLSNILIEVSTR
jgi:hypothetical protein